MGYRSDIAYIISFPNNAELDAFVAQAKVLSKQPAVEEDWGALGSPSWGDMESALDECSIKRKDDGKDYIETPFIGFRATDVKWYPSYPDVAGHLSLLALAKVNYDQGGNKTTFNYLGENMPPITCTRIAVSHLRIGEDDNDTEVYEYGVSRMNGHFGVKRELVVSGWVSHLLPEVD